jgi:DNA-binding transcriptional ArsR family regulator
MNLELSNDRSRFEAEMKQAAEAFKALGDPTRLKIYRFLSGGCCQVAIDEHGCVRPMDGPTMGEVCCQVLGASKVTSTLSHHLKELRLAGLIAVERRGRHFVCAANPAMAAQLGQVLGFDDPSRK